MDSEGDLYVVDGLWGLVQVFDREGRLLYYFGQRGTAPGRVRIADRHVHRSRRPDLCGGFFQPSRPGVPLFWIAEDCHIEERQGRYRSEACVWICGADDRLDGGQPAGAGDRRRDWRPRSRTGDEVSRGGARPDFCMYCHAPHSGIGGRTPLWNQTLSTQVYTPYTSTTEQNKEVQPAPGADSSLCLSCHDGTVAPGTTAVYGKVTTMGTMYTQDILGSNLQPSHPFSLALPLKDSADLVASLAQGKTADPQGAVKLINGNIECTSCHNAHVQGKDLLSQNFLVRDSSKGEMCLACHDPNRQMAGQVNPLKGWTTSIHNTATNKLTPQANVGSYPTVMQSACHWLPRAAQRDGSGPVAARRLRTGLHRLP